MSAPTWSPDSTRQPPGAAGSGTATASRSPSGSFARTRSAPSRSGLRQRQVERARLLGVGERDGREIGVGLLLGGDHERRREAGPLDGPQREAGGHPVQGRVDDAQGHGDAPRGGDVGSRLRRGEPRGCGGGLGGGAVGGAGDAAMMASR